MIIVLRFIYTWLLPPAIFVLILAWLAWRLWPKARQLAVGAYLIAGLLYLLSLPPLAEVLLRPLEYKYPLSQQATGDIIVLLGGGSVADVPLPAGWQGQITDGANQRLVGAYVLHRRTGLPIIPSGGESYFGHGAEALIMRDVLVSLGMASDQVFVEAKSLNTRQNAELTADLLRKQGWKRPILVTSAFHMRRSVEEFKRVGVTVVPYPVGYYAPRQQNKNALSWVPSASALYGTSLALKEYMGLAVLLLREVGTAPN